MAGWKGHSVVARMPAMVRGHLAILLLVSALPTLGYLGWELLRSPQYRSSLVLSADMSALTEQGGYRQEAVDIELATAARLIGSHEFLASLFELAGDEGVGGIQSVGLLGRQLSAEPLRGTRLLQLSYQDANRDRVAPVLDFVANHYLDYRQSLAERQQQAETHAVLQRLQRFSEDISLEQALWSDAGPEVMSEAGPDTASWRPVADRAAAGGLALQVEQRLMQRILDDYYAALAPGLRLTVADPASDGIDIHAGLSGARLGLIYLASFGIAFGLLWLTYRVRPSTEFPDLAAERLGLPLAAVLPRLSADCMEAARDAIKVPDDDIYTESLRALRTRLQLRYRKSAAVPVTIAGCEGRVLIVSAQQTGEGSSGVAAHLALMLGQVERVLLVDASLRRGATGAAFCGLPVHAAGLSHLIAGAAPLHRCIHRLEKEGIDVLPAGVMPPNPRELLSSKRFSRVMAALTRRYDYIIMDAPPLASVSDTLLLARQGHHFLLVLRAGGSRLADVQQSISELQQEDGGMPLELVVNAADQRKLARYGYTGLFPQVSGATFRYHKPGGRFLSAS